MKGNLLQARHLLGDKIERNIHLVHGDATCLPFPEASIDLYWSAQTLQHVPDIHWALQEARRILKTGAWLINYSLNRAWLVEAIYHFLGKDYIVAGKAEQFWLARATSAQRRVVEEVFCNSVKERFTEILFQPSFGLCTGREGSRFGKADAQLSNSRSFWNCCARQRSFEVQKR